MASVDSLAGLFNSSFVVSATEEDFDSFECSYALNDIQIPSKQMLIDTISLIDKGGNLALYLNFDDHSEPVSFTKESSYESFQSAIELAIRAHEEDEQIFLKIKIAKTILQRKVILYSLEDFAKYLNALSTFELIELFSEKLRSIGKIIFCCEELPGCHWSASFGFVNAEWDGIEHFRISGTDRSKRLKGIQVSTHAVLLTSKLLLPEDFSFTPQVTDDLKPIFLRVEFLLTVMAMFDITNLSGETLTFRLNGYKGIDGSVDLLKINVDDLIGEYVEIYNWINESGNLNDKLGLARNIISLHLNSANDLSYSGSMFSSLLSAYKVYEKQNIKQYIEIRNKLSDQLIDYNKRANSIVEGFAGTFQKSALSVLTLFSSIIALKVLSSSSPSSDFVNYSVIFSAVILGISLIYMLISRSEAVEQRRRYERSYKGFKDRYTDLLNEQDIKKILNNDNEYILDINFINKKIRNYTWLWLFVLVLITAIILTYFFTEKLAELSEVMTNYPNV